MKFLYTLMATGSVVDAMKLRSSNAEGLKATDGPDLNEQMDSFEQHPKGHYCVQKETGIPGALGSEYKIFHGHFSDIQCLDKCMEETKGECRAFTNHRLGAGGCLVYYKDVAYGEKKSGIDEGCFIRKEHHSDDEHHSGDEHHSDDEHHSGDEHHSDDEDHHDGLHCFNDAPKTTTYAQHEEDVKKHGGRLPTTEEVVSHLNGHPLFKGDYWVPVRDGDKRDYIQIGDVAVHTPGKSHVKAYGFPAWGDKEELVGHTGVHKQSYCAMQLIDCWNDAAKTTTYAQHEEFVKAHGGRLPTTEELVNHLHGEPLFKGDYWAPVRDGDKRDYIQIGDVHYHKPGKSHVKAYGFPAWGDKEELVGHTGVHKQSFCAAH